MKSFHFSLNRVRSYKSQILDKEKKVLGILLKKRDDILFKIVEMERFQIEKSNEAAERQRIGISISELASYSYLIENARLQIKLLNEELVKAEAQAEEQRKIVLEIYQEKTGMDKLEEKQLEEYRFLEAKETESEIMQVISNKLADRGQGNSVKPEIA